MRRSLFMAAVFTCGMVSLSGVSRAAPEQEPLTPREAARRPAGEEVTVIFRVKEGYALSGTVLVGALPSFGLAAEEGEGDPRFALLVYGDLVKVMDRFGMKYYDPGEFFQGKRVQVTGKLQVFPATKDRIGAKPSYQLAVSRWEDFRILPDPAR